MKDDRLSLREEGKWIRAAGRAENWEREIRLRRFRPETFLRKITLIEKLGKRMKISYIREMKRSYLTIETEDEEQREKGAWEAGMLEQNRIRGLLPMRVRYEEGREIYCYDITSRQPLERILETHAMTGEQVRSLFWQLYRALEEMEKYLLESGGILLTPELIYAEPERFEIGLCAVPGGKEILQQNSAIFLQYLLKHVDHRDKDCVVLAYGLYQESLKENYGIEDLVKIVAEEKQAVRRRRLVKRRNGLRGYKDRGG